LLIGRYQGAIYSDTGYALALTNTHAIVWPYAVNTAAPETFTFTLPHPSRHGSEPLPLGSLASASASSPEPGLVVVMPLSGKITYWESIASAATLDLIQQQRNGVELSIPGMLHGETVIQILNAESAGFVLAFSTGRLAYMSVRDSQGRPAIAVQFLRGTSGTASGGIFGSIRNALSSSWRGDLACARAGRSVRPGERDVVTASSKGRLQAWSLTRGGHNALQAEKDAREEIVQAMKATDSRLSGLLLESFEVLDFAFIPKSSIENAEDSDYMEDGTELLLLTSLSDREATHYALVQVMLSADSLEIGNVRHIRSYKTPVNRNALSKPRVFLPSPGVVAFLLFDKAIVVSSLAALPDSPDSQLLADDQMVTQTYEDVVDFRKDAGVEITGSGMEEPSATTHSGDETRSKRHKAKYPAVLLLVKGGGLIRVAAIDPKKFTSVQAPQVTAKSKLEQAVFFGSLQDNPLTFNAREEIPFTSDEYGEAALRISREITTSKTPYLPSMPGSIEQNLKIRSQALRDLAFHLRKLGVKLDRVIKWRLMWDAEKMAGALRAWEKYDAHIKSQPEGEKRSLWSEIVVHIHENIKSMPIAENGETDRVRHWFINDVHRLEVAVCWAFQSVKLSIKEEEIDHAEIVSMLSEANDLTIGAMNGALEFRANNMELYGLGNEHLQNGILVDDYEGLPQFWTSVEPVIENIKKQTNLAREITYEYYKNPEGSSGQDGQPDPEQLEKIRLQTVGLTDLACTTSTERYRWLLAQPDPKLVDRGVELENATEKVREVQIKQLDKIGLVDDGIKLAQKHRVFSVLVALIVEDIQKTNELVAKLQESGTDTTVIAARIAYLQELVNHYYQLFGREWADALYVYYVRAGELFALLNDNNDHQRYLTDFLRSSELFAKVAWINEVNQEKDFNRAAKDLLKLGLLKERDVWSKKVELSIGKLARLASKKYSETQGLIIPDGGQAELEDAKKQLALIQIQDKIYSHIRPAIKAAIDSDAELQLALDVYGNDSLKGTQALASVLAEKLGWLLEHKSMGALDLIDLLTLLGSNKRSEERGMIEGEEFYYALEAVKSSSLSKDERKLTEKVIWRRCMLHDNWTELNHTDLKDDEQVSIQLQRTALYSTMRACYKNSKL
jgi:nuclear pore complex protein Nup133